MQGNEWVTTHGKGNRREGILNDTILKNHCYQNIIIIKMIMIIITVFLYTTLWIQEGFLLSSGQHQLLPGNWVLAVAMYKALISVTRGRLAKRQDSNPGWLIVDPAIPPNQPANLSRNLWVFRADFQPKLFRPILLYRLIIQSIGLLWIHIQWMESSKLGGMRMEKEGC